MRCSQGRIQQKNKAEQPEASKDNRQAPALPSRTDAMTGLHKPTTQMNHMSHCAVVQCCRPVSPVLEECAPPQPQNSVSPCRVQPDTAPIARSVPSLSIPYCRLETPSIYPIQPTTGLSLNLAIYTAHSRSEPQPGNLTRHILTASLRTHLKPLEHVQGLVENVATAIQVPSTPTFPSVLEDAVNRIVQLGLTGRQMSEAGSGTDSDSGVGSGSGSDQIRKNGVRLRSD